MQRPIGYSYNWFVKRNGLFIFNIISLTIDGELVSDNKALVIVRERQKAFLGKANGIMVEELSLIKDPNKAPVACVRIEVRVNGLYAFAAAANFTLPCHRK